MIPWPLDQQRLLDAAARGDREAFRALTGPWRAELRAHCARILGNPHDADDAVQETLLRAWTRLTTLRSAGTVRAWLHVIATNTSLNMVKRERRHAAAPLDTVPEQTGPSAGDAAEHRADLEAAFHAAVHRLPASQRAAIVLRDVLGWTPPEIAELLGESVAAINSALQRGRATLAGGAGRAPGTHQLADLRAALLARYVAAWDHSDVERIVSLARADAQRTRLLERLQPRGGGWVRVACDMPPDFRPAFMRPD